MPAFDAISRRQKAVLWPPTQPDQYGQQQMGEPSNIRVRWINKKRLMAGPEGQQILVDATAVVGQEVAPESLMWLATDNSPTSDTALEQWYGVGSSGDIAALMEVVAYEDTPDIKARQFRRTVGLVRYKGSLPT